MGNILGGAGSVACTTDSINLWYVFFYAHTQVEIYSLVRMHALTYSLTISIFVRQFKLLHGFVAVAVVVQSEYMMKKKRTAL